MNTFPSHLVGPVAVANSELIHMRSGIVGQDYQVKIRLPEDYAESDNTYPVLYLLDGDHAFAMATDIVQYLIYGEHIPDLIVVSPAYGSKRAPQHGGTNMRERDLLPYPVTWTDSPPGADPYLQFFQDELIPAIESSYRIDMTDRTLWGYSLGALFVLHTLFRKPGLFRRYGAVDGFHDAIVQVEADYARQHASLPARLHLSSGPNADVPQWIATLQSRQYSGFEVEYAPLNDGGHFTVGAEGLTKGLVALFRGWESR